MVVILVDGDSFGLGEVPPPGLVVLELGLVLGLALVAAEVLPVGEGVGVEHW